MPIFERLDGVISYENKISEVRVSQSELSDLFN